MKILALCATKGKGKTHMVKVITDAIRRYSEPSSLGIPVIEYAFSRPIKEIAKIMFGWDSYQIEHHKEDVDHRYGISPRQFLQFMGTEVGQESIRNLSYMYDLNVGRNIWLMCFQRFIEQMNVPNGIVIVHDLRFPHEEKYLREHFDADKLFIWRVEPYYTDGRILGESEDRHKSENLVPFVHCDHTVYNYIGNDEKTVKKLKERGLLWELCS